MVNDEFLNVRRKLFQVDVLVQHLFDLLPLVLHHLLSIVSWLTQISRLVLTLLYARRYVSALLAVIPLFLLG